MKTKFKNDIILGFFVLVGLLIFISVIYFLGKQNQMIGSGVSIHSTFKNVSGLKEGNNVRLSGIKVGVVENLEIISDTSVQVTMTIEKDASRFIKKDARAVIESEGLMGNKIVTITGGSASSQGIEDGDNIKSRSPVGIDQAIQTITNTAQETNQLFTELTGIIKSIRAGEGLLGAVVSDPGLRDQFTELMVNMNKSSDEAREVVLSLKRTTNALNEGNGLANMLIHDPDLADKTSRIIDTVAYLSGNLAAASDELRNFTGKLNNRRGMIDKLLTDTLMAKEMEKTIINIREGSENIEGAASAIENSWLLNLFSGNKKEDKQQTNEEELARKEPK